MGFRLVPKSVTLHDLNGVMALILRYFTEFSCTISSQNNYEAYLGFKIYF